MYYFFVLSDVKPSRNFLTCSASGTFSTPFQNHPCCQLCFSRLASTVSYWSYFRLLAALAEADAELDEDEEDDAPLLIASLPSLLDSAL